MKLLYQIVILFAVITKPLNTLSQIEIQNMVINENIFLHQFKDSIIVISILDPKYSNELKKLNKLANKYKTEKVVFIAITDKIDDFTKNILKANLTNYQHLSEEETESTFNTYQTGMYKIYPIQIILNKKRAIIYLKKGLSKNIDKKLAKKIERLIVENQGA